MPALHHTRCRDRLRGHDELRHSLIGDIRQVSAAGDSSLFGLGQIPRQDVFYFVGKGYFKEGSFNLNQSAGMLANRVIISPLEPPRRSLRSQVKGDLKFDPGKPTVG